MYVVCRIIADAREILKHAERQEVLSFLNADAARFIEFTWNTR